MKKIFGVLFFAILFASCSNDSDTIINETDLGHLSGREFVYNGTKYTLSTPEGLGVYSKLAQLPELTTVVGVDGTIEYFDNVDDALKTDVPVSKATGTGIVAYSYVKFREYNYIGESKTYEGSNLENVGVVQMTHGDSQQDYYTAFTGSFILSLNVHNQTSGFTKRKAKLVLVPYNNVGTLIFDIDITKDESLLMVPDIRKYVLIPSSNPTCTPDTYWFPNAVSSYRLVIM